MNYCIEIMTLYYYHYSQDSIESKLHPSVPFTWVISHSTPLERFPCMLYHHMNNNMTMTTITDY